MEPRQLLTASIRIRVGVCFEFPRSALGSSSVEASCTYIRYMRCCNIQSGPIPPLEWPANPTILHHLPNLITPPPSLRLLPSILPIFRPNRLNHPQAHHNMRWPNSNVLNHSLHVPNLPLPLARPHAPRPLLPLILPLRRQIHQNLLPPHLLRARRPKSQRRLLRHRRRSATRRIQTVQEV